MDINMVQNIGVLFLKKQVLVFCVALMMKCLHIYKICGL